MWCLDPRAAAQRGGSACVCRLSGTVAPRLCHGHALRVVVVQVIGATSSLTYNIVGHLKTVIILTGGVVFFGVGGGVLASRPAPPHRENVNDYVGAILGGAGLQGCTGRVLHSTLRPLPPSFTATLLAFSTHHMWCLLQSRRACVLGKLHAGPRRGCSVHRMPSVPKESPLQRRTPEPHKHPS